MIHGFLPVWKEAGFTSHDVVAKLRGILRQKKIGHTGTLDPNAVGVLPVGLGIATRACPLLPDKRKIYLAKMRLGIETDTEDIWGTVTASETVSRTEAEIREAVMSFRGTILQTPPMYSAKKVGGKKLYELARQGKSVERAAVPVDIESIDLLKIREDEICFRVACSAGTYIRTLCSDIGKRLGTYGCMTSLVRESACGFWSDSALTLSRIEELRDTGKLKDFIVPTDRALSCYKELIRPMSEEKRLKNGNAFQASPAQGDEAEICRVYLENGLFIGLFRRDPVRSEYVPFRMFPAEEQTLKSAD